MGGSVLQLNDLLKMDGYDDCVVGVCRRFNDTFLLYDIDKVIEKLKKDMPEDDAWEHFEFNMVGGWVGEGTWAFVKLKPLDKIIEDMEE